jgi:hypothetical protein
MRFPGDQHAACDAAGQARLERKHGGPVEQLGRSKAKRSKTFELREQVVACRHRQKHEQQTCPVHLEADAVGLHRTIQLVRPRIQSRDGCESAGKVPRVAATPEMPQPRCCAQREDRIYVQGTVATQHPFQRHPCKSRRGQRFRERRHNPSEIPGGARAARLGAIEQCDPLTAAGKLAGAGEANDPATDHHDAAHLPIASVQSRVSGNVAKALRTRCSLSIVCGRINRIQYGRHNTSEKRPQSLPALSRTVPRRRPVAPERRT